MDQALVIATGDYPEGRPDLRNAPISGVSGVRDWIRIEETFLAYPSEDYPVDMRHFVSQVYDLNAVIDFIQSNNSEIFDIFTELEYREIGIGYISPREGCTPCYHHYVFIVGSQPNVIPLLPYQPDPDSTVDPENNINAEHLLVRNFQTTEITFWLPNERYYRGPDRGTIGEISLFQVSESRANLEAETCPQSEGNGWQRYNLRASYNVTSGLGDKTLYVKLCDQLGRSTIREMAVRVMGDQAAVADFIVTTVRGPAPLQITFDNASTGSGLTYEWDFNGDGTIDTFDENPTYTYPSAGLYTVILTIRDGQGNVDQKMGTIEVLPALDPPPLCPQAQFTVDPLEGTAPLTVTFTGTSTGAIDNWVWDFNGDNLSDSNEQSPIYTFDEPGEYIVKLIVNGRANCTGGSGNPQSDSQTVIRVYPPIQASFSANITNGTSPLTVTFNAISAPNIVNYQWDFDGDGLVDQFSGTTHTFTYVRAGTYTAQLIVTDAAGNSSQSEIVITVLEGITFTPTLTETPTPSATLTETPTPSATLTETPTPSATLTETPIAFTATVTSSPTETPISPTPTETPTPTNTPSNTHTPTIAPDTPTLTNTEFVPPVPSGQVIRLVWTQNALGPDTEANFLVIVNQTGEMLSEDALSRLTFRQSGQNVIQFSGEQWQLMSQTDTYVFREVEPGECLIIYHAERWTPGQFEAQELAGCAKVEVRASVGSFGEVQVPGDNDLFWRTGTFEVLSDGVVIGTCDTTIGSCTVNLTQAGGVSIPQDSAAGISPPVVIAPSITPIPMASPSLTPISGTFSLEWQLTSRYLVIKNISGRSQPLSPISGMEIRYTDASGNTQTFPLSRLIQDQSFDYSAGECLAIHLQDTQYPGDDETQRDFSCSDREAYTTIQFDFWADSDQTFQVITFTGQTIVCRTIDLRCVIP
ncbi:MAG: PKD domain-containing protein [Anaerolineae bacterium]|nr:PKD domain-containing protein [Anaerolineae bacterium]